MDEMTQQDAFATVRAVEMLDRLAALAIMAGEIKIARTLLNAARYLVTGRITGQRGIAGLGAFGLEPIEMHWGPKV